MIKDLRGGDARALANIDRGERVASPAGLPVIATPLPALSTGDAGDSWTAVSSMVGCVSLDPYSMFWIGLRGPTGARAMAESILTTVSTGAEETDIELE